MTGKFFAIFSWTPLQIPFRPDDDYCHLLGFRAYTVIVIYTNYLHVVIVCNSLLLLLLFIVCNVL